MTIGEGISTGATKAYDRMESARQFNASLAEKAREADQSAFVSLANSPRTKHDNSDEKLAEEQRQFDATYNLKQQQLAQEQGQFDRVHAWDDALNQQKLESERLKQQETSARIAHYQQLEEQTRQKAADLRAARHTTVKDMFWMARNNGGYITSPELLAEFAQRFDAPDLAGISTAGFFYNEDGSIKTPQNDDNKPARFGVSYNYVDPQTGKIAIGEDGRRVEKVFIPKFQDEWVAQGQFWDGSATKVGSSGLTFEQRQGLENQKFEGRKMLKQMDVDAKKYATDANNAERRYATDMNNNTRLKIADIGAELKRMGYDVDEKKLAEAIRHNKATEAQGQQRVDETTRHNKAGEAHRTAELGERTRHNTVTEEQGQQRLDETATHHAATEEQGNRRLDETERAHKAREAHRTTNKVTIKSGDNKGNGSQQKIKPPEGAQMPQGAIAFGGYKQNIKTGKLVPYWVGPDNKPIYR